MHPGQEDESSVARSQVRNEGEGSSEVRRPEPAEGEPWEVEGRQLPLKVLLLFAAIFVVLARLGTEATRLEETSAPIEGYLYDEDWEPPQDLKYPF